jgi:hypothetical protein
MSLIEINWRPDDKQLRGFGLAALIATAIISLLLYYVKDVSIFWAGIVFGVGFIIFLSSRIALNLTRVFYVSLTAITMPIGICISFVLMSIFYFLLLMPFGLIFRMIGRDPLNRKFDSKSTSYWIVHRQAEKMDRYFRQF